MAARAVVGLVVAAVVAAARQEALGGYPAGTVAA
jgi:hypothetical protein